MTTKIDEIIRTINDQGGHCFIVGGYVRDTVLGYISRDIDIEVFGINSDKLRAILSAFGQVDLVGASFGVYKVHGVDCDFSLPRTDSKTGQGHRGFNVHVDHGLDIYQAAERRDFTFNSLSIDTLTGKLVDPFGGVADIHSGTIRHTGPTFGDDPLRVLRAFQFAGRFNFTIDPKTAQVCQELLFEASSLPVERIWSEWEKWAAKSIRPSAGLTVLVETGWVKLWPELAGLQDCPQDPTFHPEGGVWEHTCQAVNRAADIAIRDNLDRYSRVCLVLAALCHDFGKAVTTKVDSITGHIISPGHAREGKHLAESFLSSIGAPFEMVEIVSVLVAEHLTHIVPVSKRVVGRLINRLGRASIAQWARLVEVDHSARSPLPGGLPESAAEFVLLAAEIGAENGIPAPVIRGRHLLNAGWQPGPTMGQALRAAFSAQLEGEFATVDGGVEWVAARF